MDVLSPWLVGRFDSSSSFRSLFTSTIVPDAQLTSSRNQGYAPVLWPGFSWHNLQHQYGSEAPLDEIPRNGGDFFSMQYEYLSRLPNTFLYGAMFDEFDESTAIAKAAATSKDIPSEGSFLYLSINGEQLDSDFYLRLSANFTSDYHEKGKTTKLISNEINEQCDECKEKAKEIALGQAAVKLMKLMKLKPGKN